MEEDFYKTIGLSGPPILPELPFIEPEIDNVTSPSSCTSTTATELTMTPSPDTDLDYIPVPHPSVLAGEDFTCVESFTTVSMENEHSKDEESSDDDHKNGPRRKKDKKQDKKEKNRVAAAKSRKRKRDKIESLSVRVQTLEEENFKLKENMRKIEREKNQLSLQLKVHELKCPLKMGICQENGEGV
ncbi:uncharacterized protein LOC100375789 [Saccoglossus kowalevskii]|uniref:Cyclic AMP-dependent transcription factor ATF-5-like n=1 Tax=Saccoglossus kowalevskii TaxID=10224 RepID=A0ABM0MXW4_SACKO|nr:PREDICTED: cyclic AMP-dependent transcription factor ATF-5-like [Saccoglossus kowalevskii]